MATTAQLMLRYARQVELVLPHRRDLLSFQVGAADTLNTAYAGTTAMFRIRSGQTFRSPGIRDRRLGRTQYCNRGLSRATYDPEDYWVAGGTLPHDAVQSYVRVSEVALDGTVRPEGPILVVPPPGTFSTPRPQLSLVGTAPGLVTPPTFLPPPGAVHVVFPQFVDYVNIFNKEPPGGSNMYVAFEEGSPGHAIFPASERNPWDAAFKELFIWGDGADVEFDAYLALVNGVA